MQVDVESNVERLDCLGGRDLQVWRSRGRARAVVLASGPGGSSLGRQAVPNRGS